MESKVEERELHDDEVEKTIAEDESSADEAKEETTSTDASAEEELPNLESLQKELDDSRNALRTAQDQSLRAIAEADNTRKRAARDVENAHKFALERFARDLLPSLDNFDAAIDSAEQSDVDESTVAGFKLSVKSLLDSLERNGIVSFDPMGEVFDPEKQKALTLIEHADSEPGSVVEVIRKGYLLNDRLLREAEVVVSKEPDKAKNQESNVDS